MLQKLNEKLLSFVVDKNYYTLIFLQALSKRSQTKCMSNYINFQNTNSLSLFGFMYIKMFWKSNACCELWQDKSWSMYSSYKDSPN